MGQREGAQRSVDLLDLERHLRAIDETLFNLPLPLGRRADGTGELFALLREVEGESDGLVYFRQVSSP